MERSAADQWGEIVRTARLINSQLESSFEMVTGKIAALLVNGGGLDGGDGAYFANAGDDVHAVGSLAPIIDGYVGCVVIKPDGSRYVARAVPDPLAE